MGVCAAKGRRPETMPPFHSSRFGHPGQRGLIARNRYNVCYGYSRGYKQEKHVITDGYPPYTAALIIFFIPVHFFNLYQRTLFVFKNHVVIFLGLSGTAIAKQFTVNP
jgi:hypothetical protein